MQELVSILMAIGLHCAFREASLEGIVNVNWELDKACEGLLCSYSLINTVETRVSELNKDAGLSDCSSQRPLILRDCNHLRGEVGKGSGVPIFSHPCDEVSRIRVGMPTFRSHSFPSP